jgi:hypothetical protein
VPSSARLPSDAATLCNLGNALVLAVRVDEGIAKLEAALTIAPSLELTRTNLANVHADRARDWHVQGRAVDAIAELETGVQLQPRDAVLWNQFHGTRCISATCPGPSVTAQKVNVDVRVNFRESMMR